MNLKKQAITLALLVIILGLGQIGYNKLFNSHQSPEKSATQLLSHHLEIDEVINYVSSSDREVLKEIKEQYLALVKLPKEPIKDISVAANITLSETAHKVDLSTDHGIISLSMVQENGRWVAFLNLKDKHLISQLLTNLDDAELRENEYDMLAIYRKLHEVSPSDVYEEKIKLLTKFIEDKKLKEEYVKNVYISDLQLKGNILTGLIKNQGDRDLKVIKANLQIINPENGAIDFEYPIVVYEVIPGSFVFGQPIKSNHQKKFGLNVQELAKKQKLANLFLSVTEVDFFE